MVNKIQELTKSGLEEKTENYDAHKMILRTNEEFSTFYQNRA